MVSLTTLVNEASILLVEHVEHVEHVEMLESRQLDMGDSGWEFTVLVIGMYVQFRPKA